MYTIDTLPVIVVNAVDDTTASRVISELIDNDVTESYHEDSARSDRVWRLVNKYYTADVRLHASPDGRTPALDLELVEAYLIHVTKDEEEEGVHAAANRACGSWSTCDIRVVTAECAFEPPTLATWAGKTHAELVPLSECAPESGEPSGWERARAALHAHTWRSLRRTDVHDAPQQLVLHDDGTEELAVERAEAFAAALSALGPALQRRAEPRGDARLDEAEALVRVFCRALGLDPERC